MFDVGMSNSYFVIKTWSKNLNRYFYLYENNYYQMSYILASRFVDVESAKDILQCVCKDFDDIDYEKSKIIKITTTMEEVEKNDKRND